MTWHYQRSIERIQHHLDTMGEIEIEDLTRRANLEGLLSETCCRTIEGSHVYLQVSNFAQLASNGLYAEDDYKRLIQGVHIYQREITRIVEQSDVFDGLRVHFQGPKLHALFYRPIGNREQLAVRAALLLLVLKDFVRSVFNPAFPHYDDFIISGGADLGVSIGTRDGMHGDRELLFLGSPANHAAKIIDPAGHLRLTTNVYKELPEEIQLLCKNVAEDVYEVISPGSSDLETLLTTYNIGWDRQASAERIKTDKEHFLLKDITYSSADVPIDLDSLSINNNKRVTAASIFADVAGFTRYIDAAETDVAKRTALRVFHAIRKELAVVIKQDFDGLRIQYQGDRVQGLFHLPKDDEVAIALKAVEAAVGLQSSMEHTLKTCLPEAQELRLAIGIGMGITLVSKLGTRGHRDRICLGEPVECAATCEERCDGGQIGITKQVFDAIPDYLRDCFSYNAQARCYVATDLTADKVERIIKGTQTYRAGVPVFVRSNTDGITVTRHGSPDSQPITPARRYAP